MTDTLPRVTMKNQNANEKRLSWNVRSVRKLALIRLLDDFDGPCFWFNVHCRIDQDTYRAAMKNAEQYNLVRVRTGGWSEF